MAWWTRVEREDGKVEETRHDGKQPKMSAAIALNFARNVGGVPLEKLGLYKRDPSRFPDEPNLLPEMMRKLQEKAISSQLRTALRKPRKRQLRG